MISDSSGSSMIGWLLITPRASTLRSFTYLAKAFTFFC